MTRRTNVHMLLLILVLIVVGCSTTANDEIPTVMILPSATDSPTAIPTRNIRAIDLPATWTLTATGTQTVTPSATGTSLPTWTATLTSTGTITPTPTPNHDAFVSGESGVNLRSGPSTRFNPPLDTLDANTAINILAISTDGEWYQVRADDGRGGWAFGELITLNRDLPADLQEIYIATPTASPQPIIQVSTPGQPVVIGGGAQLVDNSGAGSGSPVANVISISSRTRQIYQTGRTMGNNARVFVKVGDSITDNQPFMTGYGTGEYELGGFGYLQESIDFFDSSAFTRDSIAAASGFNAAAVQDPIWAPPGTCQANETPLACEYRIMHPSVAFIMYGSVDVQLYGGDAFRAYLSGVVQYTISQGVIPILTTFPNGADYYPGQSEEFNGIIRSIASQEQIPLIELRNPALNLPDRGVTADKFHLSQNGGTLIALSGEHNQYGLTLRNMLSLQALDDLRRGLSMG